MNIPNSWNHKSGYHLNGNGKSIEYEHISRQLLAIVECMFDQNNGIQYYTVIFDTNESVWIKKKSHEFFEDKDKAKENLKMHMEYYE